MNLEGLSLAGIQITRIIIHVINTAFIYKRGYTDIHAGGMSCAHFSDEQVVIGQATER